MDKLLLEQTFLCEEFWYCIFVPFANFNHKVWYCDFIKPCCVQFFSDLRDGFLVEKMLAMWLLLFLLNKYISRSPALQKY